MSNRSKAFSFTPEEVEEFPLEINGETVTCVGDIDGIVLLDYTASMRPEVPVARRAHSMMQFLQECIVPSDWDRFRELVRKNRLDVENVAEISGYLSAVYSTRPTKSAEPSSTGQTTTGSSSEGSSPSEESTGAGSTPPI